MTDPVSVTRDGHRTFLKWHRGRRYATDPVFTGRRILEGMVLGASVEVDLVVTGDGNFAVLHDQNLDRETTGHGRVDASTAIDIRALRLRDNDGGPIDDPVMLLDDLCALMATKPVPPAALLQLDYKQDETVLDARTLSHFASATRAAAHNIIVSSGSAAAITLLTDAVPGMRSGYDPSDEVRFRSAIENGRLQEFVDDALAAAPNAEMIYLHWEIVLRAAEVGFDMVDAFHRAGKRIDAWTIQQASAATLPIVQRLLALKVDQITTDDPEGLAALLEANP